MKKISILIYSLASGGAERQVSILLKELSKKYKIYLVLMNDTIFYEIPKNVEVFYLEKSNPFESGVKKLLKLPFLAIEYNKFLKEKGIGVSISFMTRPNYVNLLSQKSSNKIKTIISERSMFSLQYSYKNLQSFVNKKLVKLYNKANFIIPNSYGNGYDLEYNFHIKVNKEVIYNMLEIDKIEELRQEKIDLIKDKFTFITVGRLDEGKNHPLLIETIKDIDVKLWIIGDGYLREDLELRIEDLGLKDRVKLLGRQKNVYKFLDKADCFVFSSNHEGFPNVLLEALACELPIISTDCPSGPREILAPGSDFTKQTTDIEIAEYGILTPVGDVGKMKVAMQMVIQNEDLRKDYKTKVLNRAKDFNVKNIIKEWEEIL